MMLYNLIIVILTLFSVGNAFETDFLGDTGFCTSKQGVPVPKIVTTKLKFVCDHNTKWNKQNKSMKGRPPHGGSKAPTPVEIKFDNSKCMVSF